MKKALVVVAVAWVVVAGVAAWVVSRTIRELEAGLQAEKQHTASLSQELQKQSAELAKSRSQTMTAREQAQVALRDAEAKSATAQRADQQKAESDRARQLAEQATQAAQERETKAHTELAELRERRKKELDQMQRALAKIAPTERTASGMVIELANDSFHFDFDSAIIRPENKEILSRIAGVLLASEGYRLFIYGHTDDVGPGSYNQELSVRRAKSVADYLQNAGVPNDLMQVEGFGKSSPRVKNNSSVARQKNRRVEIGIVDSILEYKGLAPDA